MKRLFTLLFVLVAGTLAAQQCAWTVYMIDDYGDGWNGGYLSFDDGTSITTITLPNPPGISAIAYVTLTDAATVTVTFTAGSWIQEVAYTITDASANTLVDVPVGSASSGVVYTGVNNCPSCLPVTNVTVTNVVATSAVVSWNAGGSETEWAVTYGATGFTPSGYDVIANSTNITLTGLSPQTTYDVYVRAICAAGDTANFVGPSTFSTPCLPLSFPYYETFDGVAPNLPSCWETNNSSAVYTTTGCSGSNNESLQLEGVTGAYAYSPIIDVSGQTAVQVSYLYRKGDNTDCGNTPESGDNINVDYWNGTMWVNLANYDGSTAPNVFTPDSFLISSGLTSSFRLRFEIQSGSGYTYDNYNFDNLEVKTPSPCYTSTLNITLTSTPDYCNNGGGSATVTASGGVAPYAYTWDNGSTTTTSNGYYAGMAYVTVADGMGCKVFGSTSVNSGTPIMTSVTAVPATCGSSDGSISVSVTGGTAPYTYLWEDINGNVVGTSSTVSGLPAGGYLVTITDVNGCEDSNGGVISNPGAPSVTVGVTSVTCNGMSNGSASVSVTGGTAPYSYLWTDITSGNIVGTTSSVSGLPSGSYAVSVSGSDGCSTVSPAFIDEPSELIVTVDLTNNISCYGFSDGGIYVSASGGTTPYSYKWSNLSTTSNLLNISEGIYQLTVTDANLCMAYTPQITITGVSSPYTAPYSEDFTNYLPMCWQEATDGNGNTGPQGLGSGSWASDGFANNGLSGAAKINLWSTGKSDWLIAPFIQMPTTGSYILQYDIAFMAYGSSSTTSSIGSDDSLIVFVYSTNTSQWDTLKEYHAGNTAGISGITEQIDLSAYAGDIIQVAFWGSEGTVDDPEDVDISIDNFAITPTPPCFYTTITATTSSTDDYCASGGGSASVTNVTGGATPYSYSWNTGDNTSAVSGLYAGVYAVTITDASGCDGIASVSISSVTPITSMVTSTMANCGASDGSISVSVTGGTPPYNYYWTNLSGNAVGTTATVTGLPAGGYPLTITDANGCVEETGGVINNIGAPTVTAGMSTSVTCNGDSDGSVTVTASGGTAPYSYLWIDIDNLTVIGTTTSVTGLPAGTYIASVTDANGCVNTDFTGITEPSALSITLSSTDVSTVGGSDGSVSSFVSGGIPPYSYTWNTGATTTGLTGLSAGAYSLTVTDVNGCTSSANATVSDPDCSNFAISLTATNVTSIGGSDGTASVMAYGGIPPYSYNWSNAATTSMINGLSAGTYSVTVTDVALCSATGSVSVQEVDCSAFVVSVSGTDVSTVGGSDGSATAVASGGSTPYTYVWNNGATTSNITGLSAGVYVVTVTANSACVAMAPVTINQPSCAGFSVNITTTPETGSGMSDGSATAVVSGGVAPYAYSWNTGATTAQITGLTAGTYTVTVADNVGCMASASGMITVDPCANFNITITSTPASSSTASDGSVTVTATGGTAPYNYTWSNNATGAVVSGLAAGTYSVTVTDANNCSKTGTVTVSFVNGLNNYQALQISVFPNPAKERVVIQTNLSSFDIEIINMIGQTVYKQRSMSNSMEINQINLENGVYFINISHDQYTQKVKLVINK